MRLVFCNTTGRSGTKWLSSVLSKELEAVVKHEGSPRMVELRSGKNSPSYKEKMEWWKEQKLPHIKKISKGLPYIDTSHLINKEFLKPLMDLGIVPDLIILRRSPREVAQSLLKLNTIPFRTRKGRRYCFNKYDDLLLPLPIYDRLSDYQLCYWYCLECQARAVVNRKRIIKAGGRVCKLDFNEVLRGKSAAKVVSSSLKIPGKSKFRKLKETLDLSLFKDRKESKNRKKGRKCDQRILNVDYDQEEIKLIHSIKDFKI